MSSNRISARYAKSLIDLAIERGELEKVKSDIDTFSKAVENRDFYLLLKSPIINGEKKQSILHAIFKDKLSALTFSFLDIVTRKGREMHLPEICEAFQQQYKLHLKISTINITTAAPLQEVTLEKIKSELLKSDITLDKLEVNTKVDKSIIGGFIIEVDDKLYDASVIHQLDQFKKSFSNNNYNKSF